MLRGDWSPGIRCYANMKSIPPQPLLHIRRVDKGFTVVFIFGIGPSRGARGLVSDVVSARTFPPNHFRFRRHLLKTDLDRRDILILFQGISFANMSSQPQIFFNSRYPIHFHEHSAPFYSNTIPHQGNRVSLKLHPFSSLCIVMAST